MQPARVTVIPFGINNAVPNTSISPREARQRLGIQDGKKTILFFGESLLTRGSNTLSPRFSRLRRRMSDYRLIIAGRPKNDSARNTGAQSGKRYFGKMCRCGRVLLQGGLHSR